MPAPRIDYIVKPVQAPLQGSVSMPGDKSISHRAVILGAIAEGVSVVDGFLHGEDTLATVSALRRMGVQIEEHDTSLVIKGVGSKGLRPPPSIIDLGNSGTAARLLTGLLAGQAFDCTLTGDASLIRRPMGRITAPLKRMNADIRTTEAGTLPIQIKGGRALHGIEYEMPVASAQLKSALLLAGLQASGRTTVIEPVKTRDHTERLLIHFGCPLMRSGNKIAIERSTLRANSLRIPGDISSAAFFLIAGSIVPGADIVIENVGLNPTRHAVIDILRLMGADIEIENKDSSATEPIADLHVRHSELTGVVIPKDRVPIAIDEFPAIMIAACYARGETVLEGAEELRVKESDRIHALAEGLTRIGVHVKTCADGMRVQGGRPAGGVVDSHADHRIAMAFSVAGLAAMGPITIEDCKNVDTSFPGFIDIAGQVGWDIERRLTEND